MNEMDDLPESDLRLVLDHSREVWDDLRGARILVTGGTGFFGRWLVESFLYANRVLELGAKLAILSRHPSTASGVTVFCGDVRDFAFTPGAFSHIIHAAAETSHEALRDCPWEVFNVSVRGTQRVLEQAARDKAKTLFISSGAIYGRVTSPAHEDTQGVLSLSDPSSAYAEGKRSAEFMSMLAGATIARGFAFIGPHLPLDRHFAAGNFLRDTLRGGPILVKGDGSPLRSYLYAADLAAWLWVILTRGKQGRAYNVGSDFALSIAELADHFPAPSIIERKREPNATINCYVPVIARARDELGLDVWTPLDEAIKRTLQWHHDL